mmetsp:Transcript_58069/g.66277  ORF Transcript_58069/g.66277 Transcript_58069/m.66277 type:complete len:2058 (-) Transcript_58069:148-6321(-)
MLQNIIINGRDLSINSNCDPNNNEYCCRASLDRPEGCCNPYGQDPRCPPCYQYPVNSGRSIDGKSVTIEAGECPYASLWYEEEASIESITNDPHAAIRPFIVLDADEEEGSNLADLMVQDVKFVNFQYRPSTMIWKGAKANLNIAGCEFSNIETRYGIIGDSNLLSHFGFRGDTLDFPSPQDSFFTRWEKELSLPHAHYVQNPAKGEVTIKESIFKNIGPTDINYANSLPKSRSSVVHFVSSPVTVLITHNTFQAVNAHRQIHLLDDSSVIFTSSQVSSTVTITHNIFNQNRNAVTGMLLFGVANVAITNNTFSNNTATQCVTIIMMYIQISTITNNTIDNNNLQVANRPTNDHYSWTKLARLHALNNAPNVLHINALKVTFKNNTVTNNCFNNGILISLDVFSYVEMTDLVVTGNGDSSRCVHDDAVSLGVVNILFWRRVVIDGVKIVGNEVHGMVSGGLFRLYERSPGLRVDNKMLVLTGVEILANRIFGSGPLEQGQPHVAILVDDVITVGSRAGGFEVVDNVWMVDRLDDTVDTVLLRFLRLDVFHELADWSLRFENNRILATEHPGVRVQLDLMESTLLSKLNVDISHFRLDDDDRELMYHGFHSLLNIEGDPESSILIELECTFANTPGVDSLIDINNVVRLHLKNSHFRSPGDKAEDELSLILSDSHLKELKIVKSEFENININFGPFDPDAQLTIEKSNFQSSSISSNALGLLEGRFRSITILQSSFQRLEVEGGVSTRGIPSRPGSLIHILTPTSELHTQLTIFDSRFIDNTINRRFGVVSCSKCRVKIKESIFHNNHRPREGGCISIVDGSLEILSSIFSFNSAFFIGGVLTAKNTQVEMRNSVFLANGVALPPEDINWFHMLNETSLDECRLNDEDNDDDQDGQEGGNHFASSKRWECILDILKPKLLTLSESVINFNELWEYLSTTYGGVINLVVSTRFSIEDIEFVRNFAEQGAVLNSDGNNQEESRPVILVESSIFRQNFNSGCFEGQFNAGSTVTLNYSYFNASSSAFESNASQCGTAGIDSTESSLTLSDIDFKDAKGGILDAGAHLNLGTGSQISLVDSTIGPFQGQFSGAIFGSNVRNVTIQNCRIITQWSVSQIAAIAIDQFQYLKITKSIFRNNTGLNDAEDIVATSGKSVSLNQVEVDSKTSERSSILLLEIDQVVFSGVKIEGSGQEQPSAGCVSSASCSPLSITQDRASIPRGNKVEINEVQSVEIENSQFLRLQSQYGGAVRIKCRESRGDGDVTVSKVVLKGSSFLHNEADQHGGAIFVQNCHLLRMENNRFEYNLSRSGRGGAIYSDLAEEGSFDVRSNNILRSNCAYVAGGAIWTNAENKLNPDGLILSSTAPNCAQSGYAIANTPYQLIPSEAVQTDSPAEVPDSDPHDHGIDFGDQFKSGDRLEAHASWMICDRYGQSLRQISFGNAKLNQANDEMLRRVAVNGGRVDFTDTRIVADPGSKVRLAIEFDGGDYKLEYMWNLQTRECQSGEIIRNGECYKCGTSIERKDLDFTEFSVDKPPTARSTCKSCPENAYCQGGDDIGPQPGYWRPAFLSITMFKCPFAEMCIGKDTSSVTLDEDFNSDQYCSKSLHARGPLCDKCEVGYFKVAGPKCLKCLGWKWSYLTIAALLILLIAGVLKLRRSKHAEEYISILKIITGHFQIVSIILTIQIPWGPILDDLRASISIFFHFQPFGAECLSQNFSQNVERNYGIRLAISSFAPLFAIILISIVRICLPPWRGSWQNIRQVVVSSTWIVLILTLPYVSNLFFANVQARDFDQYFRNRLVWDLEVTRDQALKSFWYYISICVLCAYLLLYMVLGTVYAQNSTTDQDGRPKTEDESRTIFEGSCDLEPPESTLSLSLRFSGASSANIQDSSKFALGESSIQKRKTQHQRTAELWLLLPHWNDLRIFRQFVLTALSVQYRFQEGSMGLQLYLFFNTLFVFWIWFNIESPYQPIPGLSSNPQSLNRLELSVLKSNMRLMAIAFCYINFRETIRSDTLFQVAALIQILGPVLSGVLTVFSHPLEKLRYKLSKFHLPRHWKSLCKRRK